MPQVPSGYAYRSRDVLRALAAAGLDPVAATRLGFPASRGIADYSPVESVYGVVHHRFNFDGLRQYSGIPLDRLATMNAESLRGLVERLRPEVVLAATPSLNGSVASALSSAAEVPFVYDVRGFPEMTWAARQGGNESELYRLRREAETGCCAAADAVITTSETMKAELVGRGIDAEQVTVVPHVVDTQRYSPQPRDEELARTYGLDRGFVVGSITSLTDYEGVDELLLAVARARAEQDVRALIVGDGPARAALQAQARELGLEDPVVFTGRVPQERVTQHYALLDAVALPRRDLEVCRAVTPLKPFEAMAMGVPVVASDLPALAEPVVQSGGGLLVPPGSEEALAAAILQLAEDVKTRQRLGSNARAYLVAHHNPAVAADAIRSALALCWASLGRKRADA
jgi:glycosyltransferase involved in cell wall biosynthesis